MVFTHLTMTNVPRPLFLTFCQKNAWVDAPWNELPPMKSVRDLQFDHITVDDETGTKNCGFVIIGMPGHPVEDLTFSDIRAIFPGGGTAEDATNNVAEFTPENLGNRWPEIGNLRKTVPASGLFAHHVKGITLQNVEFSTTDSRCTSGGDLSRGDGNQNRRHSQTGDIAMIMETFAKNNFIFAALFFSACLLGTTDAQTNGATTSVTQTATPEILTPEPAPTPRINGPKIFGVRPGSPFLYSISATGTRPMTFSADGLPDGLQLDPATGHITGTLNGWRI